MGIWDFIQASLGLNTESLTLSHMAWRGAILYGVLLVSIRLIGDRRFSGQHAAIDVVLSIILGATLSRAINGSAPFFPTLGVGLLLVTIHWLLAALAFHFPKLEKVLKGQALPLICNGDLNYRNLRRSHITRNDLTATFRLKGHTDDFSQVSQASLETSGDISLSTSETNVYVLDISVEPGVQTVRIRLER